MRIFFVFALIGCGVYQIILTVQTATNLDQLYDFWNIWKYVLFLSIIGIIAREIVQAKHRAKWPKIYRIERAEPINHDA